MGERQDVPVFDGPWPRPELKDCRFYHSMTLPALGEVTGEWDIRPDFDNYVGGVALAGRDVLDVGTCTGAIAFEAERRGARVIATDVDGIPRYTWLPFEGSLYHQDRRLWDIHSGPGLLAYKNGFWLAWHALGSSVRVAYEDLAQLRYRLPMQDVVLACAVMEHLSDPVSAIGHLCRLAKQEVVLGYTPVDFTPGEFMRPLQPWTAEHPYVWWTLSADLYRRVFGQLGFSVEFREAEAMFGGVMHRRPCVVARRIA